MRIPKSFDSYSKGYDLAFTAQSTGWSTEQAEKAGYKVFKSGEFLGAGLTADMYQHGVQHPMPFDPNLNGKPNGEQNQGFGRRYQPDVPRPTYKRRDDLEEMFRPRPW